MSTDDAVFTVRRWAVGLATVIVSAVFSGIWFMADLNSTVETALATNMKTETDIRSIEVDVATALQVLAGQGEELETIRKIHATTLSGQNAIRDEVRQLRAELNARTDDRWYKSDEMRWQDDHLKLHEREYESLTRERWSP